jgi:hypothetical protein
MYMNSCIKLRIHSQHCKLTPTKVPLGDGSSLPACKFQVTPSLFLTHSPPVPSSGSCSGSLPQVLRATFRHEG